MIDEARELEKNYRFFRKIMRKKELIFSPLDKRLKGDYCSPEHLKKDAEDKL